MSFRRHAGIVYDVGRHHATHPLSRLPEPTACLTIETSPHGRCVVVGGRFPVLRQSEPVVPLSVSWDIPSAIVLNKLLGVNGNYVTTVATKRLV